MVHPGGRPCETDYVAEANLLLEWAKRSTSMHLAQFAIERDTYSSKLYEWRDASPEFSESLNKAKDYLNIRTRKKIESKDYRGSERIAGRDITNYDTLLKIEERADKAYESKLKQKEAEIQALTAAQIVEAAKSGELTQK